MQTQYVFGIDPKLKELLSPLSKEEYQMLEESIVKEGCRDKLIVWKNLYNPILVDGHNRYEICKKHNIPYEIELMEFDSYQDIEQWIMRNQLARRNLTDKQRSLLIGMLYKEEKKQGYRTDLTYGHNDQKSTSERIAEQFGIGEATVRRAETFSDAVEEIRQNIEPDKVTRILTDEIPISKKDVIELAREEPETQAKVMDLISKGQAKKVEEAKKQLDPIDIEYDKRAKEIEAKSKRIKKVMNLLNYTQHLGITEQSIQEYLDVTTSNHDFFISDLEKLKNIIDEVVEMYSNLTKIRRIK